MTIRYPSGGTEDAPLRLQRIFPILACPRCRGDLVLEQRSLKCLECGVEHPIRNGVPILLPEGVVDAGAMGLAEEDRVSRHPYSDSAEQIIQAHGDGWVLDLGAGGKLDRRENVVQIDIFRYPAVDVVASADCLPFKDNSFDAVVSQAVFEHLQYPEWAVQEIRRVLKPGGTAKIDTAFLQPEHGYPHHFYNATETGLLHWFRDFDVQWSGVEPFQHPKWALHWFLGVYLDYVGLEQASFLRDLKVGDIVDVLQRHSVQEAAPNDAQTIHALDSLPEHALRILAAGVSVRAVNPPKYAVIDIVEPVHAAQTLNREREMSQLRIEKSRLTEKMQTMAEQLRASQEKSEYLAQFYPSARNLAQFAASWVDPMQFRSGRAGQVDDAKEGLTRAFATFITYPKDISALLDTFFSLTQQTFGGWQLLLVIDGAATSSIQEAASALRRLDQRVDVFTTPVSEAEARSLLIAANMVCGEYWMELPDGAELSVDALREIVTVARNLEGVQRIGFDFERQFPGSTDIMRCMTLSQDGSTFVGTQASAFAPYFSLNTKAEVITEESRRVREDAHIPRALVQLKAKKSQVDEPHRAAFAYMLEQYKEMSEELKAMNVESPTAARELRQLNADVGNYLGQFYFDSDSVQHRPMENVGLLRWARQSIGRWIRHHVPLGALRLFAARKTEGVHGRAEGNGLTSPPPSITLTLQPDNALLLIATFFSLSHQTHSGWELLLVETAQQSPAVRRAIRDFSKLDARVVVIDATVRSHAIDTSLTSATRGAVAIRLVDGVTLSFDAVEQVVTLLQALPGVDRIVCDYDCVSEFHRIPMRCYNFSGPDSGRNFTMANQFDASFFRADLGVESLVSADHVGRVAHIPLCLFHLTKNGQISPTSLKTK